MGKNLAKIHKNVRFLTLFFKPPCAFDAILTVHIAILNWAEKSFELGGLIYDFRFTAEIEIASRCWQ